MKMDEMPDNAPVNPDALVEDGYVLISRGVFRYIADKRLEDAADSLEHVIRILREDLQTVRNKIARQRVDNLVEV